MRKWYDNLTMAANSSDLHISKSPSAQVVKLGEGYWHLEIPASSKRSYHLAQLDDHGSFSRGNFHWKPPLTLSLQARVSAQELPGTWGFGFWNDPFTFLLRGGDVVPRFPALPDAAWFFHASPQNYLSFRDDLPAFGFLAATIKSLPIKPFWLALASPVMAFTLVPGAAQLVRKLLRKVIYQDADLIHTDATAWHTYAMDWQTGQVKFWLDGAEIFHTGIAPQRPLSLVLWIDNQYASLPPRGGVRYGTLPNIEPAWLEIREFSVQANTSA
jgi:hypothetical protein